MIETWGKNRRAIRNKRSKQEVVQEIAKLRETKSLDISSLNMADLELIMAAIVADTTLEVSSELNNKSDYIRNLRSTLPGLVSLDKLTKRSLKELTEVLT